MVSRSNREMPPLLEARELSFAYPAGEPVLQDVSLELREGELLALAGPNGAGKTTLAKTLNGLLRPLGGTVRFRGEDLSGWSVAEIARRIGFVFQNPDHQILGGTVREELSFGPRNLGIEEAEVDRRVARGLDRFGLEAIADAPPALLSFGMRRLISIASVLTMEPQAVILDEPTKGLDAILLRRVLDSLQAYREEGRAILLITHDMALVGERASRCAVMQAGRIQAIGEPGRIFSGSSRWQELGLEPPQATQLAAVLGWAETVLTVSEFAELLPGWLGARGADDAGR